MMMPQFGKCLLMFFSTARDSDSNSQILFHMIMHSLPPSWNPMENLSSCKALLTSGLGNFHFYCIYLWPSKYCFANAIPLFHKRLSSM